MKTKQTKQQSRYLETQHAKAKTTTKQITSRSNKKTIKSKSFRYSKTLNNKLTSNQKQKQINKIQHEINKLTTNNKQNIKSISSCHSEFNSKHNKIKTEFQIQKIFKITN